MDENQPEYESPEADFADGAMEAVEAVRDEVEDLDGNPAAVSPAEIISEWADPVAQGEIEAQTAEIEHAAALEDLEVLAQDPPDAALDATELRPDVADELLDEIEEPIDLAEIEDLADVHSPVDDAEESGEPEVIDLLDTESERAQTSPLIEEPPSRPESEAPIDAETLAASVDTETLEGSAVEIETNDSTGKKRRANDAEAEVAAENDELLDCPVRFQYKDGETVYLVGENAILPGPPKYLLTLDTVFGLLRERHAPPESQEQVLRIGALDLEISEDNVYAQETRISDLIELLDVLADRPGELVIDVEHKARFIHRLNTLFAELQKEPQQKRARV